MENVKEEIYLEMINELVNSNNNQLKHTIKVILISVFTTIFMMGMIMCFFFYGYFNANSNNRISVDNTTKSESSINNIDNK